MFLFICIPVIKLTLSNFPSEFSHSLNFNIVRSSLFPEFKFMSFEYNIETKFHVRNFSYCDVPIYISPNTVFNNDVNKHFHSACMWCYTSLFRKSFAFMNTCGVIIM